MMNAEQVKAIYKRADVPQAGHFSSIGNTLGGPIDNWPALLDMYLNSAAPQSSHVTPRSLESYGKEPFGETVPFERLFPDAEGGGWVQLAKGSELEALSDPSFSPAVAASSSVAPSAAEAIRFKRRAPMAASNKIRNRMMGLLSSNAPVGPVTSAEPYAPGPIRKKGSIQASEARKLWKLAMKGMSQ